MNLQTIADFLIVGLNGAGLSLSALRWLLARHDQMAARIIEVEKELLRLRAELPIDYVRREDWIRFGNALEAKMAELREDTVRSPGLRLSSRASKTRAKRELKS